MLMEIVKFVKKHGWKQQVSEMTGICGSFGTNFYKDGKVLTISLAEEGSVLYPDDDELEELFGSL